MKAPVGLLSDRTVLRSKMEGPRPDKFQFAVLVPSRVWVRHLVRAIRFGWWLLLFYLALYRGV